MVNKKHNNEYSQHDHADAFATCIFAEKQSKIECLENFIKDKNLWEEYEEFEKRSNKNLRFFNSFLFDLKNYGVGK